MALKRNKQRNRHSFRNFTGLKYRRSPRRFSRIECAYADAQRTLPKIITDEVSAQLRTLKDDELVRVYTLAQNFERMDFAKVIRRIMDRRGIDTFKHSF